MDRREAIKELTQWRDQMKSHGVPNYGKKLTALNLAIEALEEKPQKTSKNLKKPNKMDSCYMAQKSAVEKLQPRNWEVLRGDRGEAEKHQLSGETSTISEKEMVEGDAESATTTDCNDCIWNTCNYNKIDWEVSEDCISREFALEVVSDYVNYPTEGDKTCAIKNAPSVTPKPIMTEEVREALMRLSMCAREECTICKCEDNCGFDKQVEMATENMNIILNAFNTIPTERTGEWIPVSERLP